MRRLKKRRKKGKGVKTKDRSTGEQPLDEPRTGESKPHGKFRKEKKKGFLGKT